MAITTNGSATAGTVAPAKKKITRSEAFQLVRSNAANEFANVRSRQGDERAHFEQNYGSTTEVDESFLRDMEALMLRATAIASAGGKRDHDGTVKPIKELDAVAATLAKGITECRLYLARRKATSMFERPKESDFLGERYELRMDNPTTWVGKRAQTVVDDLLTKYDIVDDPKPSAGVCQHLVRDTDDSDEEPTCVSCGKMVLMIKVTDEGERWITEEQHNEFMDSIFFEYVSDSLTLPQGVKIDDLLKLTKAQLAKEMVKLQKANDPAEDDEAKAPTKGGGRKKASAR